MNLLPSPQYYPNTLQPIEITRASLLQALEELRTATRHGAELVEKDSPPDPKGTLGLFMGVSGVSLAFLRLNHQASSLREENDTSLPDYLKLASERIPSRGPDIPLLPGRLSPLGSSSPLAQTMMRIQEAAVLGNPVSDADVHCLREAITIALKNGHIVSQANHNMGGDDILYGRAGLLWSILNIRVLDFDEKSINALTPIFEAVPQLVKVIINAGRQGAQDYTKKYGYVDALPLMWTWMESHYGLGAVHGMTGILGVLLACKPEELNVDNQLSWIADTITGLCKLCIANHGHLLTSIPPHGSPPVRESPLVQICHGSPAILLLLACARRNFNFASNFWQPEWDKAIVLASERVWEEGLLSKGGSLCHGIAGNAWPLLLLHDSYEYDVDFPQKARQDYVAQAQEPKLMGDYFLSRALAFLLQARETPPYRPSPKVSTYVYRMPDRPYSLSEGLAGTVCAWANACVAIQARLRKMDLEEENAGSSAALKDDALFQALDSRKLGLPTLPYYRPTGLL